MRDVLGIFLEIIVALAGAVLFGSVLAGLGAFAVGCAVWGGCRGFLGWRRRRAARHRDRV